MAATCPTCGAAVLVDGPCPNCLHVGAPALDQAIGALEPDVKVLLAEGLKELGALPLDEVQRVVEEARAALLGGRANAPSPAVGRLFAAAQDRGPRATKLVIAAVLQACATRIERAGLQ
jgi:hypothetical protein